MLDIDARLDAAMKNKLASEGKGAMSLLRFVERKFEWLTLHHYDYGLSWDFIADVIKDADIPFRGEVKLTGKALSDAYRAVWKRQQRTASSRRQSPQTNIEQQPAASSIAPEESASGNASSPADGAHVASNSPLAPKHTHARVLERLKSAEEQERRMAKLKDPGSES